MQTAAELRAFADRRDAVADIHAENAARWSGRAAALRDTDPDQADMFDLMVWAAARNEQAALEDARRARREARAIEFQADRAAALAAIAARRVA